MHSIDILFFGDRTGGKRDEKLMIPLNDSLSGTLSMDQLCARTTIALSADFATDQMWLNGAEESLTPNTRMAKCIHLGKMALIRFLVLIIFSPPT